MLVVLPYGSRLANSLITVAEADAHIADSPYPTAAWSALTAAKKEYRLILAAKFMKSRFSWSGWEIYEDQALPFPRWFPRESDSQASVPSDVEVTIPEDIKRAQAYIAFAVIHRGLLGVSDPADGKVAEPEIKSLSLFGRMRVETTDTPAARTDQSIFEGLITSEYFQIGLLLADYVTTINIIPHRTAPVKLNSVSG